MNRPTLRIVSDLTVFYPTPSLSRRIDEWADENGRRAEFETVRDLPGVRRRLHDASFVVIDASEDAAKAADAYLQASHVLGAENVVVYTERTNDDLEILTRSCGSAYYLGPMDGEEWQAALERKFSRKIPTGVVPRRRAA